MHLKSKTDTLKQDSTTMANTNGNDSENYSFNNNNDSAVISSSGSSNQNRNNNNTNNNNNNSNNNNNNNNNNGNNNVECGSIKTTTSDNGDIMELKIKKQVLEQRKLELEKLLNEKNWLLQQIQKQESQILHGNFEYLNFNDIFANLAQQYKEEQEDASNNSGVSGLSNSGSGILRRKSKSVSSGSKENQSGNANNNRSSEISNRSSEYDNYPRKTDDGSGVKNVSTLTLDSGGMSADNSSQSHNPNPKNVLKKRTTSGSAASMTYLQLQRQHMLQQQAEQQILQQHFKNVHDAGMHHQQQSQKLSGYMHYHPSQQQPPKQYHSPLGQHQSQAEQIDAISLYSVNSANIATLRQQPIAPQQQPIVVQCDKYYLSPTHQNYNDGGFIKSSQNIKKYVSPMSSPTQSHIASNSSYEQPIYRHLKPTQHQSQNLLPVQQLPSHGYAHCSQHQFDVISLLPSTYATLNRDSPIHNLRWRSQLNIPHHSSMQPFMSTQDMKSNSSDLLSQLSPSKPESNFDVNYYHHSAGTKTKTLDEISVSSLNSEIQQDTQKRTKNKQWLESSLDGPVPATCSSSSDLHATDSNITISAVSTAVHSAYTRAPASSSHISGQTHPSVPYARTKLSSQSMSSGHHYSTNAQKNPHGRQIQDDEGRYMKLSQSTSYLNSIEANAMAYKLDAVPIDLPQFRNLPPKASANDVKTSASTTQSAPPPRPPRTNTNINSEKAPACLPGGVTQMPNTPLSQDIRIESPKNMTVVQQATFQPYKEITKPFEMSDFYKYSTKFRQKDNANVHE